MYRTGGTCMCGGMLSMWPSVPRTFQGVMHSPVGCLRREMKVWELKDLYKQLTGFEVYSDDLSVVFQVVMLQLRHNPEASSTLPVVLTPVELYPPRYEITPPRVRRERYRTPGTPGSQQPNGKRIVVYNPGPIKPPWET